MSKAMIRIIEEQIRHHRDAGRDAQAHYLEESLERAKEAIKQAPQWYTRQELVEALQKMNYSTMIAEELADWFTRHLQLAFNKGYSKGSEDLSNISGEVIRLKDLLWWVLYHHQGGHSEIGQPIRRALGIGQFDPIPEYRIMGMAHFST